MVRTRSTPFRRISDQMKLRSRKTRRSFANDFSVLNPTIWANEAVLQLLPNMVYGNLVARDFDNLVARFGDVVNAYVPSTFVMSRKGAVCENLTTQDASGSSIQVALNQYAYVSFVICDGEEDRNQLDLVDSLLTPAVLAMAQGLDRIIASQVVQFLGNSVGHLNQVNSTNIQAYVLAAREKMNRNNVPLTGRILALTPGTETTALQVEAFTEAQAVGDQGQALREAALGRKYGFNIFMSQQQPEVTPGSATIGTVLVNNAAGYPAGATVIANDGAGAGSSNASLAVGMWVSIGGTTAGSIGDDVPHRITAVGASSITLDTGLNTAVVDNAIITILAGGLVNNAAGYGGTTTSPRAIGWNKEILTDTWTSGSPPQVGQFVTFGSDATKYVVQSVRTISATAFGIQLDRPLVTAIADNAPVNLGPSGKYNFAFAPQAITLVSRPLAAPRAGTGAISRTVIDPISKIAMRVTITYDGVAQGHRVTVDSLFGIGILNSALGVPMLG